jgi:hypothetical protein
VFFDLAKDVTERNTRRAGSPETHLLDAPEDTGAAWYEVTAGTWTLSSQ